MSSAVSVISGCSLDEDSRLQNSSMTFRETCTISRCAEGADSRVPSSFWEGAPSTHTNKCPSGRLQVTGNHPAGAGSLRDASRKAALIPVRTDPALALRRPSAATIKEPKSLPFNVQQRRPKGKEQHKPTLLLGLSSFPLVLLAPLYTYPSAHQAVVERQSNEAESCLLDEVGIQDTYLMRFSWDTGCHWLPKAIRGTLVTKKEKKNKGKIKQQIQLYTKEQIAIIIFKKIPQTPLLAAVPAVPAHCHKALVWGYSGRVRPGEVTTACADALELVWMASVRKTEKPGLQHE